VRPASVSVTPVLARCINVAPIACSRACSRGQRQVHGARAGRDRAGLGHGGEEAQVEGVDAMVWVAVGHGRWASALPEDMRGIARWTPHTAVPTMRAWMECR
jgi:hypothetical protein